MKTPVLYLTRNGLLEPLGQSQVFSYLRGLSDYYNISLITYERPEDWADSAAMSRARDMCSAHGIRWLPQQFRLRPRVVAPAASMFRMAWLVRREVRQRQIRLIHARSYIPATVALVVGRLTGVPFIFDMRALWPEEMITAHRLRRGSFIHRAIVMAERACLRQAGAVVSLTHAAVEHLSQIYARDLAKQKVVVIPTCVDLDRFQPSVRPRERQVIGCLGSVLSGWFRIDLLTAFLTVAAQRQPELEFAITTRDDPERVREQMSGGDFLDRRTSIGSSPFDKVHEVLQEQVASVMFYAGGEVSELGRSPTRMAEILGCGLPVVANEGVGDVARIIHEYRVGVIATGAEPQQMQATWDDLQALMADPNLAARCRQAAEEIFSLETGTASYACLYRDVIDATASLRNKK